MDWSSVESYDPVFWKYDAIGDVVWVHNVEQRNESGSFRTFRRKRAEMNNEELALESRKVLK